MKREKRHPNVININDVEELRLPFEPKFRGTLKRLGAATGGTKLGCSWTEIPPGFQAFPKHAHTANEEAVYVLEGKGELEIGEEKMLIESGDYVSLLADPTKPHSIKNVGENPLRFLCFSTKQSPEVCVYPNSRKIAAMHWVGDDFKVMKVFKEESETEYLDGE